MARKSADQERYCNDKCRSKAWENYHSALCGLPLDLTWKIAHLSLHGSATFPHFAVRLAGMVLAQKLSSAHDLECVAHLNVSQPMLERSLRTSFAFYWRSWTAVQEILGKWPALFDFRWFVFIMGALQTNAFFLDSGTWLFNELSLVNHACNANCKLIYGDRSLTLKVKVPLSKDTELTFAYIEDAWPELPIGLVNRYGFRCACAVCEMNDGRVGQGLPRLACPGGRIGKLK